MEKSPTPAPLKQKKKKEKALLKMIPASHLLIFKNWLKIIRLLHPNVP